MLVARIVLLVLISAANCLAGGAAADFEPLHVQTRYPLHLMFLTPQPAAVHLPGRGVLEAGLAVDYSSVNVDQSSPKWRILMDMELAVMDLRLAYGITDRLAVRLEMPFVHMTGGFLDPSLEDYHRALGLPNYGRENRPKDSFAYQVEKGGKLWLEGDSGGLHLADMTLSAQWLPFSSWNGRPWAISILTRLKLPTGDPGSGYGSGRLDAGIFLPVQYAGSCWALFAMPGFSWHGDPKTQGADVAARPSYSLLFGAAYAYSRKWHWIMQLNYFSSPIERTGITVVDDGAYELALGIHYRINPGWQIETAFCEDIFTRAAPDFTLHVGVSHFFGKFKRDDQDMKKQSGVQ